MTTHLPTFIMIGPTKSGTSSLYFYLKQHPDIFMSAIKEPLFFGFPPDQDVWDVRNGEYRKSTKVINNLGVYQQLFEPATQKARGEASATYIYLPGTAERIKQVVPDVKLVAILRNPVDRAYSAYMHYVREGWEPCHTFAEALDAEPKRIADKWEALYHYQNGGFYYQQLSRLYKHFSPEQIRVFLYDELEKNPLKLTQSIFEFIGVDPTFTPNTRTKYNISGVPKNPLLHYAYRFVKEASPVKTLAKAILPHRMRSASKREVVARLQARNLEKPPLLPEDKQRLLTAYHDDILALQDLLGRDLSHWLK